MAETTLIKVSSKGLITLPKKVRSLLNIQDGDYLTLSSDDDRIIFRKAKIEIDYENADDAWKAYAARRLADEKSNQE
jgi:AbrB family looped-hinge helix DNA binding protein